MVRYMTLIAAFLIAMPSGFAQSDFEKKGVIQGSATFSVGMMRENVTNLYLHGFLNYFPEEKISLRGDAYYFFNSISESKPLELNHQLFAGGFYHFKSASIDPYVGFQPGIAYGSRADSVYNESFELVKPNNVFSPLTSLVAGFNYFGGKHFSLFVETRFVRGIMLSNAWPKYLDELRFSFGLAFQVLTNKSPKAQDFNANF